MFGMNRNTALSAWVCCGWMAVLVWNLLTPYGMAASKPDAARRGDVVEIDKDMKDVFTQTRVKGIRRAGELDNADLIREFAILDTLLGFVQEKNENILLRSAALESLVALFKNGIGKPDTLELLAGVVEDDKNPDLIRMDALRLIGQMAAGESMQVTQVFNLLKRIERRANKLPERLAARLYEAFGGFDKMKNVRELVLDGLNDRRSLVRAGALRGLKMYLARSNDTSTNVSRALVSYLEKAESPEERAEVINALRELQQNGAEFKGDVVKKAMLTAVEKGEDIEVQAAIRFLIRVADEETIKVFLTYAKPGARKLNFKSQHLFNMSLVEGLALLSKLRDKKAAEDLVEKIVKHFVWLLNPSNKVPDIVRETAVFGLGCIPYDFDRTDAFKILVKVLEMQAGKPLAAEVEQSLKAIMGEEPFVIVEPLTEKKRPDFEAYGEWFKKNEKNLKPGKTPWNPGR